MILRAALFALSLMASACAEPASEGPALWRVSDADSSVYIFGSVHVLPADVEWRSAAVEAAFTEAERIVVETDTSPAAQQRIGALAAERGLLPAGETLPALLPPDERTRLEGVARAAGIEPATLTNARPWLAALRLSVSFALARGHSPEYGVETLLVARAEAEGKPVGFVETPEQQVSALADLNPEDELRFLRATLRQIEEEPGALSEMDSAWARGDVEALSRQLDAQVSEAGPAVRDALLTRRNQRFADAIVQELARSDDVLVIVGAAHLLGDDNTIAMLRARGLNVEGP